MASKQPPASRRRFPLPGGRRGILLGLLGVAVVGLAVLLAAWLSA
jgi:hypothetical protein